MRDDMLRHRMILGMHAVIHAVRSRVEGGVLGSERNQGSWREEVMLPEQWEHMFMQQLLRDGQCLCVPCISQVLPRVPVSCCVRARLSVRRTPAEAMSKISPCVAKLEKVVESML